MVAAAILAWAGSVQAQSALYVQATLDVSVVSRAGTVMTVPMRMWNGGPETAQNVRVTVISPAGTSPPAPLRGPALPILVGTLGPCPDPCATPYVVLLHFDVTGIPDGTVVRWSVGGTYVDDAGHQHLFGTVRLATVPPAGLDDAVIQAVWRGFKDAIRRGDDAAAKAQFSQDPNAQAFVAEFLGNLTANDRATIDAILPPIAFEQLSPTGMFAHYAADRVTAGVLDSYNVVFVQDSDGVWRLWDF